MECVRVGLYLHLKPTPFFPKVVGGLIEDLCLLDDALGLQDDLGRDARGRSRDVQQNYGMLGLSL